MILDAIVLAGGRSSRLAGEPKSTLVYEGRSLLDITLAAVADAARVVVVGSVAAPLPDGVFVTRESPIFGGPAAGIAAGMDALHRAPGERSDWTLVLACDMPMVALAVPTILAAAGHGADAVIAEDSNGHRQYLAGAYRSVALAEAISNRRSGDGVSNLSVRVMLSGLRLSTVPVPPGATDDIDTWEDAARYGITGASVSTTPSGQGHSPHPIPSTQGDQMSTHDDAEKNAVLAEWGRRLSAELGVDGAELDVDAVLELAGRAAHAVIRPAAPLTTYLVGYAVGRAAAAGELSSREAFERAAAVARSLAASREVEPGGSATSSDSR